MVMMHVLDTSAIILRKAIYDDMVTVPEVVNEIRDENSKLYFEIKNIRVEDAREEFISEVKKAAQKTGDIYKLSETDIRVLAKALEYNATVVSDDYAVQNVAKKLGLKLEKILQKGIEKEFKWIRVCKGCGRRTEKEVCEICGSETRLKKVVKG
ncbi:ribonuclease VapC [Geoglobus acetivorans]|uniref:Ribonuclease VapC n=2 Tax=Geoglobus acetivorans TaxID=565033 RepID=A0ABZ3H3M6_GEOAI